LESILAAMKALIVDDDEAARALLSDMLREAGFDDVREATSGDEARRALRLSLAGLDGPFHLLLLDLGLPDMEGLALCQSIRRMKQVRRVPILVVTARSDDEVVEAAFAAGASDFVAKPVRRGELIARARAALRSMRRAARSQKLVLRASRLAQTADTLERAVCADALMGIANRGHFDALFRSEWRRAARDSSDLSLLLIDLDHFHDYNERYGHLGGDECLRRVAAAFAAELRRPSDLLARYGGEELVALLPGTCNGGARLVADRLHATVLSLAIPHEASPVASTVTVSIGCASCQPKPGDPPEGLIAEADEALYRAKREGRNRVGGRSPTSSPPRRAWSGPAILVVVDPALAHRVPRFLQLKREEARQIVEALDRGAYARIRGIGHNLKGVGKSYGFEHITDLGARLEDAAGRAEPETIRTLAGELLAYVDRVQVVYRRA
jgi:two-component system, chemotaxis family, response regulator WspR